MSTEHNDPRTPEPDWATYVDNLLRTPAAPERRVEKRWPVEPAARAAGARRAEPMSWVDYVDQLAERPVTSD